MAWDTAPLDISPKLPVFWVPSSPQFYTSEHLALGCCLQHQSKTYSNSKCNCRPQNLLREAPQAVRYLQGCEGLQTPRLVLTTCVLGKIKSY